MRVYVQWNLSDLDTNGIEESVLIYFEVEYKSGGAYSIHALGESNQPQLLLSRNDTGAIARRFS